MRRLQAGELVASVLVSQLEVRARVRAERGDRLALSGMEITASGVPPEEFKARGWEWAANFDGMVHPQGAP